MEKRRICEILSVHKQRLPWAMKRSLIACLRAAGRFRGQELVNIGLL